MKKSNSQNEGLSREQANIRRYMSIPAVIDLLVRKQLPLLDPDSWDDRNDAYFMELYKSKRKAGGLYGLCAAIRTETYHHWRVFTEGAGGACVVINREPLEEHLRSLNAPGRPRVRFKEVDYLDLQQVKRLSEADFDQLPFLKRMGFQAEDEYRIVIETDQPQSPALFIDCPVDWIERIDLNPWLFESQAESLKTVLKALVGEEVPIIRSSLTDSSTWKKAGDRVAGVPARKPIKLKKTSATSAKKVSN